MEAFITKEAEEKAKEIKLKADEEYEIEKASIVRSEINAIDSQYESKFKKASLAQQITKSTIANKTRLKILATKEEALDTIFKGAEVALVELSHDSSKYGNILKLLIEEGLYALMEPKVTVRVRKSDVELATKVGEEAAKEFKEKSNIDVSISIDESSYLNDDSAGGCIIINGTGKIEVNNTLEERLALLSKTALPALRLELFGKTPRDLAKVLRTIQPDSSDVSCTIFDASGNVVAVSKSFPKAKFLHENGLFPRDLRKIDSSNVDVAPIIAVRSNCILINLLHIKALVKADSVLVFDTANSEAASKLSLFMYDLEAKLKVKTVHGTTNVNQSYEFRALESILINVMAVLETELQQHLKVCTKILNHLDTEIDREKLRDLLVNSKKLTTFYQKSLLIKNVLDELLDNDDDLESMYLSERSVYGGPFRQEELRIDGNGSKDHESVNMSMDELDTGEIEMLLESYYKQCDEIVQQAETLINDIKSTEEIVNIILDANRNSLMVFELKISIYTMGATVATLAPALYGMNLKNYLEESEFAFGAVVFFSVVAGAAMVVNSFRHLKNVQKMNITTTEQTKKLDDKIRGQLFARFRKQKARSTPEQKDLIWKWLTNGSPKPK
ncbi:hypothetical protein KL920_001094 [Ogataea angusta]|uniref:Magnesium transporter n=1 Tax=Pichia angusta TaxID=870730 RepID=A0AAN6DM87_PICAN|nr:uncharacterized protein KL928_000701 [Ogataea angusta]KAG7822226.1 hypothetical protein KL928_000701 [Ogataea angusta]KAG7831574.1 hypothetical protein KL920_001094 [Ogataea angusta]KAG7832398.1 hypothetical protein KL943_005056 [Ogataea angusta]KAG7853651.1 hypothetical protein KL941_000701 [Ogataea angusta]